MVGVFNLVAVFDLLKEVAQLELIQLEVADQARPLVQVERQHGQGGPRGGISKSKDVKLPVVFCILQCQSLMGLEHLTMSGPSQMTWYTHKYIHLRMSAQVCSASTSSRRGGHHADMFPNVPVCLVTAGK